MIFIFLLNMNLEKIANELLNLRQSFDKIILAILARFLSNYLSNNSSLLMIFVIIEILDDIDFFFINYSFDSQIFLAYKQENA